MAISVQVCITSLILWHLIPQPFQNIVEIHSLAEECAKDCDHKVQQPHTTTKLQWMSPHKSHCQHTVMSTHGLAKTFGRSLGSYLLISPHSMSKAIKHFFYTLDILWVKLQDIFIRLDTASSFTDWSIKKVLNLQKKHSDKSFSPRSWHPIVSVTHVSFMNTQAISLLLSDNSSRNLTKQHSTT
jgi:hypothetical protein